MNTQNPYIAFSANTLMQSAKNLKPQQMLFGEFWYTNELSFLFSGANCGKSILSTQIADSISSGVAIDGFDLGVDAQPVLLFDLELNAHQFFSRYSKNYKKPYKWSDQLYRINEFQRNEDENEVELVVNIIKANYEANGTKVIIIDNLSYLSEKGFNQSFSLKLIRALKQLKTDLDLSILIVAHTAKGRKTNAPLSQDCMMGSGALINLCDSAFAVGKNKNNTDQRYVKQIKQRQAKEKYGEDSVALFEIVKDNNFLCFSYIDTCTESSCIKKQSDADDADEDYDYDLESEIHSLLADGFKKKDIADELEIDIKVVNKYAKSYQD